MICGPAAGHDPHGWGAAGLRLCYVQVQPGISKEDAPLGSVGETTNRNRGATTFGRQSDPMRRRELVLLLSGAMTVPRALRAQQKAMPVIGYLSLRSPPASLGEAPRGPGPVHEGMSEMGFVEGENMMWEYRWAENHYDRLPALAAELVSRKVDLIVTNGGLPSARAAKNATSTIPIVFTAVGDPVGSGLVASLAHPGGNLTGFSNLTIELAPKRLELLSELVPQVRVIALLETSDTAPVIRNLQEAARTKGLQLHVLKAGTEDEIETAFASLIQLQAGALLVSSAIFFVGQRDKLIALASRYAVPTMYWWRFFVEGRGPDQLWH